MSEEVLKTLSGVLLELPFSRRAETEADLIGLKLMALAGFNPQKGPDAFRLLAGRGVGCGPGGGGTEWGVCSLLGGGGGKLMVLAGLKSTERPRGPEAFRLVAGRGVGSAGGAGVEERVGMGRVVSGGGGLT